MNHPMMVVIYNEGWRTGGCEKIASNPGSVNCMREGSWLGDSVCSSCNAATFPRMTWE